MKSVLLTGAAGRIGQDLTRALAPGYKLRLLDRRLPAELADLGEWMAGDMNDPDLMDRACAGVDAVIHMGGTPNASDWQTTLDLNIIATRTVFDAARRNGVGKMIYGSSHHIVGFHDVHGPISPDMPVRPDSLLGISKAFGEAYCRYMTDKFGMACFALRIGSYRPAPDNARSMSIWLSPADMVRLAVACLETTSAGYHTIYGVSANGRLHLDDPDAVRIGYQPQDRSDDFLAPGDNFADQPLATPFLGGSWPVEDR